MKYIAILLLLLMGCAPDGGETTVNVADEGGSAGDPITETDTNTGCGDAGDQCGADVN